MLNTYNRYSPENDFYNSLQTFSHHEARINEIQHHGLFKAAQLPELHSQAIFNGTVIKLNGSPKINLGIHFCACAHDYIAPPTSQKLTRSAQNTCIAKATYVLVVCPRMYTVRRCIQVQLQHMYCYRLRLSQVTAPLLLWRESRKMHMLKTIVI